MRALLAIRDSLSRFYGKYDTFIRIFLKFTAASITFFAIRAVLGQMPVLNHPMILLALAAVCALLPSNAALLVGAGLIAAHFYGISLETAVVGGGILMIALLLYFSIAPDSAWPLVLTAVSLGAGFGCVPAVVFGLVSGPLGAMGVAFGTFLYYLVRIAGKYGGSLQATSAEAAEAMLQRMAQLIQNIISDREMLVMIAALTAVFVTVCLIRGAAIRWAWMAAAIAGCAVYLLVRTGCAMTFSLELAPAPLLTETGASLLAAWLAQTMLFNLDFKKTETVRFEDDEYYYFVKAVPKKKIHRRRRRRRAERR